MINKFKIVFFIIFGFAVVTISGFAEAGAEDRIDIYFTSSINGNLDGCECHAVPKAGLVSSAVFLRNTDRNSSIIVDLGDFMDVYPDDLLTQNILEVFDELNYDILSLGDQEFTEGIEYLLAKKSEYPFLNNNLSLHGDDFSSSPVVVERLGRKIGFASIIDSRVFFFHSPEVKHAIEIDDIDTSSQELIDELDEMNAQVKVLLFHGSSEKAEGLFTGNSGWDIVLYGHDQKLHQMHDGAERYLASPGDNGNRVGIASIYFSGDNLERISGDFLYFDYMKDPRDPEVKRRIDLYKKEMISRLQGD